MKAPLPNTKIINYVCQCHRQDLGLDSLLPESFDDLARRLRADDALFDNFMRSMLTEPEAAPLLKVIYVISPTQVTHFRITC